MLLSLNNDKSRARKEWLSKTATINDALLQAKQACAELTEKNEAHQSKEWELIQKLEDLQLASSQELRPKLLPCKVCRERDLKISSTPVKKDGRSFSKQPCSFPGETQLDSLRVENKKLKQSLSCLQTNFETTIQKSSQLRTQVKEMEVSTSEIQNLLDGNLAEKIALELKLGEMKDKLNQFSQAGEKKQLTQMEQEVERLRGEMEHLQQDNWNIQEKLKKELNKDLKNGNIIAKMAAETQSLKEERSSLKDKVAKLHEDLGELQDKCLALEDSSSLHSETKRRNSAAIDSLKLKTSKLSTEKSELSEQTARASEKLDEAYDEIHSLNGKIKTLEVNLKVKEEENAVLSAKWSERSCLPDKVEHLHAKIAESAELIVELRSSIEDHEKAKEKFESKINELNRTNTKLNREVKHQSEMTKKMNVELERLEEKVQELEDELEEKKKIHDKVQRKLSDTKLKLARGESDVAGSVEEVNRLEATVKQLEEDNFLISAELKSGQREREFSRETQSDIQHKLLECEAKLDATEFTILEKESHISELRCTNDMMETENATLLSQVTSLSEMVSTRNFKIEAQQAHIVRHESELPEIMQRISQLESEHGGCERIIDELQSQHEEQLELLEQNSVDLYDLKQTISFLKAELKKGSESSKTLKITNSDLQDKVTSLSDKNDDLVDKCTATEALVSKLELELKSESAAVKSAEEKLRCAERRFRESDMEMNEKVEALESKSTDMQFLCERYQKEKVELKSRVMELQAEVRDLSQLTSDLESERDSLSQQYDLLKESALSVLQSDVSNDVSISDVFIDVTQGKENPPPPPPSDKIKENTVKKGGRKAFTPLQKLVD